MRRVLVQYRTKPDRAEENQRLVEQVFQELNANDPGGVRYATFRLADGVSFVHIAVFETDADPNPLEETVAFAEFSRAIRDRCDQPPAAQAATVIGSYRFFAG
jgi:hypothetical protein